MAPVSIPTSTPRRIAAGDTWRWDIVDDLYAPAAGWASAYAFRGPGKLDVTGVANASNTGWEFTVPATTSGGLPPGDYAWSRVVTKAGEQFTRDVGVLVLTRNLATAKPGELVSQAQRELEAVDALILTALQDGYAEGQVGTRAWKTYTLAELENLRGRLRQQVAASRQRNGRLAPFIVTFPGG